MQLIWIEIWVNQRQLRWNQKKEMKEMTKRAQKPNVADSHDHAKISHDCAKWTRERKSTVG